MKNTDYAEATGYLRSMEKRILTNTSFDRAIDALNGDEALRIISQNSEIDFSSIERTEDYEIVLKAELKRVYDLMNNLSPDENLVSILSSKYDFHNVKVAVKSFPLGKEDETLFINVTENPSKLIVEAVSGGDSRELPVHLVEAATLTRLAYEESKDPQVVDLTADKLMFTHILSLSNEIDNEFIADYVKTLIDFYNVKTLLRVKNMQKGSKFLESALVSGGFNDVDAFIFAYDKPYETISEGFTFTYFGDILRDTMENYEKTGTFSQIEKLSDNFLIEEIKKSKLIAYGAEPLFSYIAAKENEIKQVRILATCKINNISNDVLKERLRENYA